MKTEISTLENGSTISETVKEKWFGRMEICLKAIGKTTCSMVEEPINGSTGLRTKDFIKTERKTERESTYERMGANTRENGRIT